MDPEVAPRTEVLYQGSLALGNSQLIEAVGCWPLTIVACWQAKGGVGHGHLIAQRQGDGNSLLMAG